MNIVTREVYTCALRLGGIRYEIYSASCMLEVCFLFRSNQVVESILKSGSDYHLEDTYVS